MSSGKTDTGEINEDVDKYYWTPKSNVPLDDFLNKSKPSMVQCKGPGTDWIWVAGPNSGQADEDTEASKAVAEGTKILETLQARLKEIQDDPVKYPTRGKKGVPSAKACRDEAAQIAVDRLKATAAKHRYTTGKWMFFSGPDYVDSNFATLARSIAQGPLSKDGTIDLCKAATSDPAQEGGQHLICCYVNNIWDVEANKRVLKIMASEHGLIPSSAKPDLYTVVGISGGVKAVGMPSSIGTPAKMMEDEGGEATLTKLREAHKEKNKNGSKLKGEIESESEDEKPSTAKTGEKRVAVTEGEKASKKARPVVKKSAKQVEKENDIFGGSDSD